MSVVLGQHVNRIHDGLPAGHRATVSKDVVGAVVKALLADYPEFDDEAILGISTQVRDAIVENIGFVGIEAFPILVLAQLERNGTLPKEVIPEEINIAEDVLDRLSKIGEFKDDRIKKVSAYIIVNSSSFAQVGRMCGAAHLGAGAMQFLKPLFYRLCQIDKSVEEGVRLALSEFPATANTDVLDTLFFGSSCDMPGMMMALGYEDQIDPEQRLALAARFEELIFKELKAYLQEH